MSKRKKNKNHSRGNIYAHFSIKSFLSYFLFPTLDNYFLLSFFLPPCISFAQFFILHKHTVFPLWSARLLICFLPMHSARDEAHTPHLPLFPQMLTRYFLLPSQSFIHLFTPSHNK